MYSFNTFSSLVLIHSVWTLPVAVTCSYGKFICATAFTTVLDPWDFPEISLHCNCQFWGDGSTPTLIASPYSDDSVRQLTFCYFSTSPSLSLCVFWASDWLSSIYFLLTLFPAQDSHFFKNSNYPPFHMSDSVRSQSSAVLIRFQSHDHLIHLLPSKDGSIFLSLTLSFFLSCSPVHAFNFWLCL